MSLSEPQKGTIPTPALLAAVFLLSAASMMFEIALTRVLSVVLRYHYVYVVVSVAICGLGLGGILRYYTLRRLGPAWNSALLVWSAALFALTSAGALALLLLTGFTEWMEVQTAISLVTVIPYLFAGVFLSTAFEVFHESSGLLYFADLVGAALSTLFVLMVLEIGGGLNACLVAAVLGAASAALAGLEERRPVQLGGSLLVLALLGLLAGANASSPLMEVKALGVSHGRSDYVKPLYRELALGLDGVQRVWSDWNAFARTDVVKYKPEVGDSLYVYTDGDVPTTIEPFDGDLRKQRNKQFFIGYLPYYLKKAPQRVLSLGSGGGMDVLLAQLAGAKQIDCVEINPSIIEAVDLFGDFSGRPYDYENVSLYITEGRSFVKRNPQQYDLLYMALTKTATVSSLGMSLVESHIHTVEAFRDYFGHLKQDGMIAFIMQAEPLTLRAFLTMGQALVESGDSQSEALKSLMIVRVPDEQVGYTPYEFLVLGKRTPFTRPEAERLAKAAFACHLQVRYVPYFKEASFARPLLEGDSTFLSFAADSGTGINVGPVYDDAPFYVDMSFGAPVALRQLAWGLIALLAVFVAVVLATRKFIAKQPALPMGPYIVYFFLLGVGFMLVELALIQKSTLYLGYPTLSLAVILFALLLGGGFGALISQGLEGERTNRGLLVFSLGATVLITLYGFLLPPLFDATLHLPMVGRALLTLALMLPLGAVMGGLFPSGLRLLGRSWPDDLAWMWGVNGFASILGSVLCMMLAKVVGFTLALWLGAACYLLVAVCAITFFRSKASSSD